MFQTHTFGTKGKHITRVGFLPVSYVQPLSQVDSLNLASGKKDGFFFIYPFWMIFMNETYTYTILKGKVPNSSGPEYEATRQQLLIQQVN